MLLEVSKQVFVNGGWLLLLYIIYRVVLWIIRKTETKTDDMIVDRYVNMGVQFALKVIPKNSQVNWVKFVGNALSKFSEAYTKEQGDSPNMTTFEKAKKLIEETADKIEFKEIKEVLEQYKENKEIA